MGSNQSHDLESTNGLAMKQVISPFMHAISLGELQSVELLLERGADPLIPSGFGTNYMNYRTRHDLSLEEIHDKYIITPLFYAAYKGHIDIVRIFLSYRTDINYMDENGNHALYYACLGRQSEMIKELYKLGADPRMGLKECALCMHKITPNIFGEVCGVTNDVSLFRYDPNRVRYLGDARTNLMMAAIEDDHLLLITYINNQRIKHNIPNLDLQDKHGNTALHHALLSKTPNITTIELLIEMGADPTIENNISISPYKHARMLGDEQIMLLLEEAMAPESRFAQKVSAHFHSIREYI